MQVLEDISLSLEAIITKICENEYQNTNEIFTESKFIRKDHFNFEDEEKIPEYLDRENKALEKDNTVAADLNQEKNLLYNVKESISGNNDLGKLEKQFLVSQKFEIADISSGFEDLSTTNDDSKSLSQDIKQKSNKINEPIYTVEGNSVVKSLEDFFVVKKEHNEENPRILTSTPKDEIKENSFCFTSVDNSKDDIEESSSTGLSEKVENCEYLNQTIDDSIAKYEEDSENNEVKFKEVSVQTIIDQLLIIQCRCGLLKWKTDDEEISLPSLQYPPLKKTKMEQNHQNECERPKMIEDGPESLKTQNLQSESLGKIISNVHPVFDGLSSKDNTTTDIGNDKDDSVNIKKIFPRIRVGLSKRAKPPPLHNKLIY